ncbi:MAG: type II toxin-antitoxin system prevent-host-death family antitoxin [Pseudonocardia sp.]|nr:type II toxin-antitoxin system prevent-host-death family antitoxin [Pseudonocardia sp.]
MRRVTDGESFTVTVHGRAMADLVPHRRGRADRSRLASAKHVDELFAAAGPGPDPDRWVRDTAEADRLFRDDLPVDPWERGPGR